jgi:type II secretory pathway component PulK
MRLIPQKQRAEMRAKDKRGFVLVTVVAIMAMSMALFGLWARAVVIEHRRLDVQQFRMQAVRLAEAGLRRAAALRAVNPQYVSETWRVSATELDQLHDAEVSIRVIPAAEGQNLAIESTAQFPASADRRAQSTKRIEIPNPHPGTEP